MSTSGDCWACVEECTAGILCAIVAVSFVVFWLNLRNSAATSLSNNSCPITLLLETPQNKLSTGFKWTVKSKSDLTREPGTPLDGLGLQTIRATKQP